MKILVFGSCNVDIICSVDRFVKPGETMKVDNMSQVPGGKGFNQALAMGRAGARPFFAGRYGINDSHLMEVLDNSGVDTSLSLRSRTETGRAIVTVSSDGENCIMISRGANGDMPHEYIDRVLARFRKGDFILLQNEISGLGEIIDKAKAKKMTVALNPSPADGNIKEEFFDKVDYLILNENEAEYFSSSSDEEEIIGYFSKNHPHLKCVLTLGKKGSVYFDKTRTVRCPAFEVPTVDTTGAGDTFTGYFFALLAGKAGVSASLKTASAASALCVTVKGASVSVPYMKEVTESMNKLRPYSKDGSEELKKKVLGYLEREGVSPTLSGLAKSIGYSEAYIARLVKKHFKNSFSAVALDNKLDKAAYKLRNTDLPVSRIISEAGYKNETFFRNAFKKKFGLAPLTYRKKCKNER